MTITLSNFPSSGTSYSPPSLFRTAAQKLILRRKRISRLGALTPAKATSRRIHTHSNVRDPRVAPIGAPQEAKEAHIYPNSKGKVNKTKNIPAVRKQMKEDDQEVTER